MSKLISDDTIQKNVIGCYEIAGKYTMCILDTLSHLSI